MILTKDQRRGLNFVAVANAGGNRPTAKQITEWVFQPVRRLGGRGELVTPRSPGMLSSLFSGIKMPAIDTERIFGTPAVYGPAKPAEGYVQHLLRLGWLELASLGDGLVVTALGRALLREVDDDDADQSTVTLLASDSPLAYPQLIGHIAESGEAFVIDAYIGLQQFNDLMINTSTKRVLIGPNVKAGDIAGIATMMATNPGRIEVRQATARVLHDRFIIGDLGVHTIGASLNGVGKTTTVLMPMPDMVSDQIKVEAESWWLAAQAVAPMAHSAKPATTPKPAQSR